jgi:choline dehydrogenase
MSKSKKLNRRKFIQTAATATAATAAFTSCSTLTNVIGRSPSSKSENGWQVNESDKFDFIIVGSGAGGGPLAAGLAREGFTVLLIEAGSSANDRFSETPAFNTKASDDPLLNWSFYAQRYNEAGAYRNFESQNSKYVPGQRGVYYPRAAGLGGCTRVNALISLYPDHNDWDNIVKLTGDQSWNHNSMFQKFQSMQKENGGWFNTSQANPLTLLKDPYLAVMALKALKVDTVENIKDAFDFLSHLNLDDLMKQLTENKNLHLNPNFRTYVDNKYNGVFNMPFNATDGIRRGVREYLLETESQYSNRLFIKTESLCTRVLFDQNDKTKAVGIEFMEGAHAYKADVMNQNLMQSSYVRKKAYAGKEVILAGGAFNTPQLLMLSGIGDSAAIPTSIPLVKHLPGVGRNLQDRYELSVISELQRPIEVIKNCTFARNNEFDKDPCWLEYTKNRSSHLYGTNGVALTLLRKSSQAQGGPDLAIFGVPGFFKGYYPGYSRDNVPKKAGDPSYFSWAILKGHTRNHAGRVFLKSDDPRETVRINFNYFSEMQSGHHEDMQAILEGLKIARKINKASGLFIKEEIYPGKNVKSDADLASWVMKESWGHHASCTNKMGLASDPMAVVDSNFKVHGMKGLRVVDASVFSDIPGLFIMLPTLMVSEKAKEQIVKEHKS